MTGSAQGNHGAVITADRLKPVVPNMMDLHTLHPASAALHPGDTFMVPPVDSALGLGAGAERGFAEH